MSETKGTCEQEGYFCTVRHWWSSFRPSTSAAVLMNPLKINPFAVASHAKQQNAFPCVVLLLVTHVMLATQHSSQYMPNLVIADAVHHPIADCTVAEHRS